MQYDEIRARVDAYANRTDADYTQNRDHFIAAGHRWIERKFLGKEAVYAQWVTTETVPVAVGVVPLPATYRASAELRVYRLPDRTPLTRIRPAWLREPFIDHGATITLADLTMLGTPTYFAVQGRTLAIRPLPALPTDLEIVGTGWAEPLVDPDSETVLTQEAPDAVIYAALRECWLFMGDDAQRGYWETQAGTAVQEWLGDRVQEEGTPVPYVMDTPG